MLSVNVTNRNTIKKVLFLFLSHNEMDKIQTSISQPVKIHKHEAVDIKNKNFHLYTCIIIFTDKYCTSIVHQKTTEIKI